MKITYNHVIKSLKFVTTTAFVVALGFKLYNIYKYGGSKNPENTVEPNFDDDDDDDDTQEPPILVAGKDSYSER
jgi:hypothetical protein